MKLDIYVSRNRYGAYILSTIVENQYIKMCYYFHTLKESKRLFRIHVKQTIKGTE